MSDPNLTPVVVIPTATLRGLLAEAIYTEEALSERARSTAKIACWI